MPTINCFHEKKVKFGKPNKFYKLIEDNLVSIIAHINDKDSIDSLYIHVDSTTIKCTNKFYINNAPIYRPTHFPILDNFQGLVEPKYMKTPCIYIDAGKYSFYVIQNNGYDLISNVVNPTVNPIGVIGQTYKNLVDLPDSKYEINIKLI
jgi:hypothetical protein